MENILEGKGGGGEGAAGGVSKKVCQIFGR